MCKNQRETKVISTSNQIVFTVDESHVDLRLDKFLAESNKNMSRNYIQKIIEEGYVRVNHELENVKKRKLEIGDEVCLVIPTPKPLDVKPEVMELEIIYEDSDLILVNKPRGLVVHPAPGNYTGTLVNGILAHCQDLSSINGVIRPGIVHRIDKDTSGLIVIAKNDYSHCKLAEQLKDHSMTREYRGIVMGTFKETEGMVDAPIGRNPKDRLKMGVVKENSKEARTHYKVLESFKSGFSYMSFKLETGRTHQIRVHMAFINHPLLGDPLYGKNKIRFGVEGQLLHAQTLGFIHPRTENYMEFKSEPPKIFLEVLEKLRKTNG